MSFNLVATDNNNVVSVGDDAHAEVGGLTPSGVIYNEDVSNGPGGRGYVTDGRHDDVVGVCRLVYGDMKYAKVAEVGSP